MSDKSLFLFRILTTIAEYIYTYFFFSGDRTFRGDFEEANIGTKGEA